MANKAQKKNKKQKTRRTSDKVYLLDRYSPFAVQEAYKTLRTNLIFSMPESGCKTIVITSAEQAEAKSTTAVNLAITFAQNSKVLLMDCDLRLPTVAQKLGERSKPGLSNLLVGLNSVSDTVISMPQGLDILPAGDVPPNPTELLGSDRMKVLLEKLGTLYDYILIDAPPVNEMADAMILSKMATGTVLVVRQGIATRESVDSAIKKLEFAQSRLLGFVYTDVKNEKTSGSYKKGYGYGYGYGKSYADQADSKKVGDGKGLFTEVE